MHEQELGPRLIVAGDAPRDEWIAARAEGVTASEVYRIAHGTIHAWRDVLDGKLNGSRFRGSRATERGRRREEALVEWAIEWAGLNLYGEVSEEARLTLRPNAGLWEAARARGVRATPDGVSDGASGERLVVEVKSHGPGWRGSRFALPPEHVAQVQWQMMVMSASHAVYAWEQVDEEERVTYGPIAWLVEADPSYQWFLKIRAGQFMTWREQGAPAVWQSAEGQERLAAWLKARRALAAAKEAESREARLLTSWLRRQEGGEYGGSITTADGGALLVTPQRERLETGNLTPEVAARLEAARAELEAAESAARAMGTVVYDGTPYLRETKAIEEEQ